MQTYETKINHFTTLVYILQMLPFGEKIKLCNALFLEMPHSNTIYLPLSSSYLVENCLGEPFQEGLLEPSLLGQVTLYDWAQLQRVTSQHYLPSLSAQQPG